jgi:putative iron-regulated protein
MAGKRSWQWLVALTGALSVTAVAEPQVPMVSPEAAVVGAYAEHAHQAYSRALDSAGALAEAIRVLTATPDEASLAAARAAWLRAHLDYARTEVFRFYGGPIDAPPTATRPAGPEDRLNGWPLNEAYLDAVQGAPGSGLVNETGFVLTASALRARNAADDEANITTGYHAVEFLLWGQDLSADTAGQRPASDFKSGINASRRITYINLLSAILVEDLAQVEGAWKAAGSDSYAAALQAEAPATGLKRILTGMATLAGFELAAERLGTALDSASQEDEQSCFSDSTTLALRANVQALLDTWHYPGQSGLSLAQLIAGRAPAIAGRLDAALAEAAARAQQLPTPFDQVLAEPAGGAGRQIAESLITSLQQVSELVVAAGAAIGVEVEIASE